jgi:uncharacterized protein (TIGR03437 family)
MRILSFLLAVVPLGAFTFQSPVSLTLTRQSLGAVAVTTADFNRDGVADVASANLGIPPLAGTQVSTVGVLLGTRGGLPGGLNEMALDGNVVELAAGEFTGDANPDLLALTITAGGARLCLYGGNGAGGFAAPLCSSVAGTPSRMVSGDFDKDGRLDVMLLRAFDGVVFTMLNSGGGTFTAGPVVMVPVPSALAVADWNGDGMPDAAVVSRTGVLTLLLSSATAIFQTTQTRTVGVAVSDVVAVDLNRDGRVDVLLTDPQTGTITYGLGRNEAAAVLGTLTTVPFVARGAVLRTADLNGDGFAEVIASTAAGILVISSNADGSLNVPSPPGAPPVATGAFGVGDINGDGRVDLVVVAPGVGGSGVWLINGQATATVTTLEVTPATSAYGQRVQVTIRVQLATPQPTAVPLAGARVELLDGATVLQTLTAPAVATGTVELANSRLELALPAGTRDLSARFVGTATYTGSASAAVRVSVAASTSFVRFQAPPVEVSYTQGLRLNAAVTGPLALANEGVVRLSVNGAVVAQGLVSAGVAQLVIPPSMPLGKIRVRLAYEGTNFLPSSSEEVEYVVRGGTVAGASAASYRGTVAPDSLAVLSVPGLTRANGVAAGEVPWPLLLGGVSVETRDSAGRVRAGLTYAGTGQLNVYLPAETAVGTRTVYVTVDGVEVASGELTVAGAAPGVFTANGAGTGAPAAYAALYRADGTMENQTVFSCGAGGCATVPMDAGAAGDSLIVTLFGTGWRGAKVVTATVDGRPAEILFTGAQPGVPGLDQANVRIPRENAGRGELDMVLFADGVAANGVKIALR